MLGIRRFCLARTGKGQRSVNSSLDFPGGQLVKSPLAVASCVRLASLVACFAVGACREGPSGPSDSLRRRDVRVRVLLRTRE